MTSFSPVFRSVLRRVPTVVSAARQKGSSITGGLEATRVSEVVKVAKDDATKFAVAAITGTPFEQLKRVALISRQHKSSMQSGERKRASE
jgi:hypothetical protein